MASIKEKSASKVTTEQVGETIVKATESRSTQVEKPTKHMYVGPPTKTLPKYTIYEGGLPEHAKKHIEACPALKSLFINPRDLTAIQLKLADGNSVEAMFYQKAEEYLSEVK